MRKNFLFVAVALLVLTSCAKDESGNVNQDSIYSIYELNYNKSTDKTSAHATFRFGGPTGTLLDLNDPAKVTFNGDELLYNSVSGAHVKDYAGFTSSGTYVYKDLDDNTFTNATPTIVAIDFPTIDTISTAGAYTFTWVGDPVATNESVTLTLDGPQQGNFEVFSTSIVGATNIVLSATKLQNLGIGSGTYILKRAYNVYTIDEATSEGGRMALGYSVSGNIYIGN